MPPEINVARLYCNASWTVDGHLYTCNISGRLMSIHVDGFQRISQKRQKHSRMETLSISSISVEHFS
jgi:hypothetical protein